MAARETLALEGRGGTSNRPRKRGNERVAQVISRSLRELCRHCRRRRRCRRTAYSGHSRRVVVQEQIVRKYCTFRTYLYRRARRRERPWSRRRGTDRQTHTRACEYQRAAAQEENWKKRTRSAMFISVRDTLDKRNPHRCVDA